MARRRVTGVFVTQVIPFFDRDEFSDYCAVGVRATRINDNRIAGPEARLDMTGALDCEVGHGPEGERWVFSVPDKHVYALRPAA